MCPVTEDPGDGDIWSLPQEKELGERRVDVKKANLFSTFPLHLLFPQSVVHYANHKRRKEG